MQPEPLLNHVQLVEQVRAAFPLEPIKVDSAFSDWGTTYSDVEPYEEHIDGKTWEELDCKYMITREDALGFLGTKQLISVLPVYLRSLIEEGVWSAAAWTMIILLTKPEADRKTGIKLSRFQAFVDSLTPAQRAVIAEVLKAFAAADQDGSPGIAARAALDSYWKTHLANEL